MQKIWNNANLKIPPRLHLFLREILYWIVGIWNHVRCSETDPRTKCDHTVLRSSRIRCHVAWHRGTNILDEFSLFIIYFTIVSVSISHYTESMGWWLMNAEVQMIRCGMIQTVFSHDVWRGWWKPDVISVGTASIQIKIDPSPFWTKVYRIFATPSSHAFHIKLFKSDVNATDTLLCTSKDYLASMRYHRWLMRYATRWKVTG
jgi:hypothetical protein